MSLASHTGVNGLRDKEGGEFGEAARVEATVELAFVAAVGGVRFEDVAVAAFELLVGDALVDYAGTAVVGEGGEEDAVAAHVAVESTELTEVFSQEGIGLFLGELATSAIRLAGLDLMTVTHIWPMLRFVQGLKLFDYQDCSLKEGQVHDAPLLFLVAGSAFR